MLVSNRVFDAVLFGALLIAAVLDGLFPVLHGAASLVAVGGATYLAAQELSALLHGRGHWTQESLATSLALCAAGFVYYWWRNQSDFALLVLSVGLMMASLMVTIAVIASVGVAFRDGSAHALLGLVLTVAGALALGVLAGLLVLALGRAGVDASPVAKIVVLGLALALWKVRENLRPPSANPLVSHLNDFTTPLAAETTSGPRDLYGRPIEGSVDRAASQSTLLGTHETSLPLTATHGAHPAVAPQRGTLLDRFLPALVLGALLFVFSQQGARWMAEPFSPSASADNRGVQQAQPPAPPAQP